MLPQVIRFEICNDITYDDLIKAGFTKMNRHLFYSFDLNSSIAAKLSIPILKNEAVTFNEYTSILIYNKSTLSIYSSFNNLIGDVYQLSEMIDNYNAEIQKLIDLGIFKKINMDRSR